MNKNAPIGIFDSGIGGLTVAKEIANILPNEQIIYFGDTAHFPYGDKAAYSIKHYSALICKFLLEKKCKSIIIACNTASSVASRPLQKILPEAFPLLNVIDPVAQHIVEHYAQAKVGVIATKGTIGSRIYPKSIKSLNDEIQVSSLATPLLAPMIEEGFFNNTISRTVIAEYLNKKSLKDVEALILGCTHYPLIENEIEEFYSNNNRKVNIINSAKVVASSVKKALEDKNLLSESVNNEHHFFVSDYTKSFEKSTKFFFGDELKLEKMDLWK
jgi:glutamate racemase